MIIYYNMMTYYYIIILIMVMYYYNIMYVYIMFTNLILEHTHANTAKTLSIKGNQFNKQVFSITFLKTDTMAVSGSGLKS